MFAVVITGPPGAGKTSVLTALVDALTDEDVAHEAIELETLAWTHPALRRRRLAPARRRAHHRTRAGKLVGSARRWA